ncbi:MAG: peptide synthase [Planctomycetaceae bacterium]|nr:MAG: peptide synthase [Planctomycetaceae bacterium]
MSDFRSSRLSLTPPDEVPVQQNIASRLTLWAKRLPGAIAIAEPDGPPRADASRSYRLTTFEQLDRQSDAIARGLLDWGIRPGMRLVMLVPFGSRFIELTFALLKAGVSVVLIDPGMGRKHLIRCLAQSEPDGFVGIPKAQAVRALLRHRFPNARWNVTVGRRFGWGGLTLDQITRLGEQAGNSPLPTVRGLDPAAVIFTTGSTGPPKGVAYTHSTFQAQVDLIRDRYDIHAGTRDLACFPLFGLFDNVMGVTTIIPDMDPTRPADVNPQRLHEAVCQWEIDQAFGSPALWYRVVNWCQATGKRFPTLRRILSAGAPVPAETLRLLRQFVHPDADILTPYGATEALPLASIESREVISETGHAAAKGRGVCVGTRFDAIRWKVIAIADGPLETIEAIHELPRGKIGELMVSGPVVTQKYVVREDQNAIHKVVDGGTIWHRMGDVGYLDDQDRFWFCGRKNQRVVQGNKTWFTVPCEAVFNAHPTVYRSALVGSGPAGGQTPVVLVEPHAELRPKSAADRASLINELRDLAIRNPLTRRIEDIRIYPKRLPVDIRHNSKIFREQLAAEIATD